MLALAFSEASFLCHVACQWSHAHFPLVHGPPYYIALHGSDFHTGISRATLHLVAFHPDMVEKIRTNNCTNSTELRI